MRSDVEELLSERKSKAEQQREERLAREAKALRQNLLRRKQQQRNRPVASSLMAALHDEGKAQ